MTPGTQGRGLFAVLLLSLSVAALAATDPLLPTGRWSAATRGHAPTPPMGWNSWNAFRTEVDEAKVMGSAQALVDTGLARLGYVYVNIDDGWWLKRDPSDQAMQIRTAQFPSAQMVGSNQTSFKPLTERLHHMGLKAGIYSDIGRNTCGQAYELNSPNLPQGSTLEREVGLYEHVAGDIQRYFGDWGFDYIKVDACGIADYAADRSHVNTQGYRALAPIMFRDRPALSNDTQIRLLYTQVSDALARVRPNNDYVFSICSWGFGDVRNWGQEVGNSWRTSDDIYPDWSRMLHNFDSAATRALYAHPGAWNDPDMLFVGTGDFDEQHLVEARSHFSLWAMLNAPLLIGYDLRTAPRALLDIWGNAELVAINQDPLGNQAVLAYRSNDIEILVKSLSDGSKAVAVFNRGISAHEATLTAEHLRFDPTKTIALRDLWQRPAPATFTGDLKLDLKARETRVFIARGTASRVGRTYLSEMPARIHVAQDGVTQSEPDPEMHRFGGWTQGSGSWPVYPGWGGAQADASPYSTGLAIATEQFRFGIGILANSRMEVKAQSEFKRFAVKVGVDNATRNRKAKVRFSVFGDGRLLQTSPPLGFGETPFAMDVDVSGVQTVELVARQATQIDFPAATTWADAALER
jgi:hypothetical protein